MCLHIMFLMYMHKQDLELNDLQLLICHKTKLTSNNWLQIILIRFQYLISYNRVQKTTS